MNQEVEVLPVGSIVRLKGSSIQILVIGRAIINYINGVKVFSDYVGCIYPDGIMNDKLLYFNNYDILSTIYIPEIDEDEEMLAKLIKDIIEENKIYKLDYEDENEGW